MSTEILVLDFDGVIVDSALECFERCLQAYPRNQISRVGIDYHLHLKARFFKYRYLVGPAPYFWDLMEAISIYSFDKSGMGVPELFNALAADRSDEIIRARETFTYEFFNSRRLMIEQSKNNWLSQHDVYPEVKPLLKSVDSNNVFIATMKDSDSVVELLRHFNISISKENILGNEVGDNKLVHINKILSFVDCDPEEMLFVDDNVHHLEEVSETKIGLAYASWGYGLKPGSSLINKLNIKVM